MDGLFSIRGKNAVVTGGSRGIGLMVARGLAEAGAGVVISSRKADQLKAAAESISEAGGDCVAVAADLTTVEGVDALAAATADRFDGSLDILINNAGATWGAPIDDFPAHGWSKVVDVNLTAVFELTKRLLPQLRKAGTPDDPARVVNVGSGHGIRVPELESYPYSASKAAVHMLTRHLARRLGPEAITVNAIAPGAFESEMTAFMLDDEKGREVLEGYAVLGRIGRPEDIVGTTLFLSSRAGSYLTGTVIPVDGGLAGCN